MKEFEISLTASYLAGTTDQHGNGKADYSFM